MVDEEKAEKITETTSVDTSPVSETSEAESKFSKTLEKSEDVKNSESGEKEQKPTRLEKRVSDLKEKKSKIDSTLERLQEIQKPRETKGVSPDKLLWETEQDVPLIKEEEYQTGVDPKELEERIAQQRLNDKEVIKKELRAEFEYKSKVQEHLSDVEHCKSIPELKEGTDTYDEALSNLVIEQYNLLNSVIDPFSGASVFVPRVKMSEIYNRYKPAVDQWRTKGEIQSAQKTVDQISESAVAPSTQRGTSEPSLDDLKKDLWNNPGKVAQYLEKKLST